MKHASVINDTVMERVANFIKEGMTEKEVADFIDAEYLKEGASGVSLIQSYASDLTQLTSTIHQVRQEL